MTDHTASAPPRSQWRDIWDQFKTHRGALLGAIVFLTIVVVVFLGPLVWRVDPTYVNIRMRNKPPSLQFPFGTDQLGRDMLARMMAGGRVSISVGLTAMSLAITLGSTVGLLAGYFRRLDWPLMRVTEIFQSLPLLP